MTPREIIARALIDADTTMSGYHQSHIDIKGRTVNVILAALKEAGQTVVPVEPTKAMLSCAVEDADDEWHFGPYEARECYRAMLAAAQEQEEG